jgi:hypothetical protein
MRWMRRSTLFGIGPVPYSGRLFPGMSKKRGVHYCPSKRSFRKHLFFPATGTSGGFVRRGGGCLAKLLNFEEQRTMCLADRIESFGESDGSWVLGLGWVMCYEECVLTYVLPVLSPSLTAIFADISVSSNAGWIMHEQRGYYCSRRYADGDPSPSREPNGLYIYIINIFYSLLVLVRLLPTENGGRPRHVLGKNCLTCLEWHVTLKLSKAANRPKPPRP